MEDIGERIRELRLLNGLTQQELGNRCDLSKGFISQLESGQTMPSLPTLADIVEALGLTMSEFFAESSAESPLYAKEDAITREDDLSLITWLVSDAQSREMEPILLELKAYGKTDTDNPHDGEEFGFVLKGTLTLHLGDKSYKIKKGDSFYFEAEKDHYLENKTKSPVVVLWIASPPSF